jgi:CheY-like chemotaxis protein
LAKIHEMQKMESLGQLTGGVAHDFNNLLMVILVNLELLRKRLPDDPMATRLLDGAVQGAERGATLTERMLAFARRQELKPETVDVPSLVNGMTDLLRRSLSPAIQISSDFISDLPAVRVDPNQLELALLNLAVNARDAMPLGGQLVIAARHMATSTGGPVGLEPGPYLRLAVSDGGLGMDADTLKRATEPFFTTKGVGKGTGLGLSMVHGFAAQSGGGMQIISAPGVGTTIELWLPVAMNVTAQEHVVLDSRAPNAAIVGPAPPTCIMVVDDDPLIAAGTADMLTDMGHTVIEVCSGAQALEMLHAATQVALVITDHAMPGMTGLQLAKQIQENWPSMPVILASGYADLPDDTVLNLPRLAKPYRQEQLASLINQLLGSSPITNVVAFGTARRP